MIVRKKKKSSIIEQPKVVKKVKSKFSEKYNNRLVAIKESDQKALKRKQAKQKTESNRRLKKDDEN